MLNFALGVLMTVYVYQYGKPRYDAWRAKRDRRNAAFR